MYHGRRATTFQIKGKQIGAFEQFFPSERRGEHGRADVQRPSRQQGLGNDSILSWYALLSLFILYWSWVRKSRNTRQN
jgi:hypothetical protein